MATPSLMTMGPVPSVHRLLTKADLDLSSVTATSFPRIDKGLTVPGHHLEALTTIIKNDDMIGKLAVHLLHSHEPLEGKIKLEIKLETTPGKWMRPVSGDSLDPASIHGLAFKIDHKGGENATFTLIPYEFAKGPSPIANDDEKVLNCMAKVANYIVQKALADVLALQFVGGDDLSAGPTAEVEVEGFGTITFPQSMQKIGTLVPVSWPNPVVDLVSQFSGPAPGEHWNEATKADGTKTHRVHVDNIETEGDVLKSLVEEGIIVLA